MTIDITDLVSELTPDEILSSMLAFAATPDIDLDVTAWQPGQPGRTILRICANAIANGLNIVTALAKAGFLDYAATVTPEGGYGWLDLLASSVYQVTREPATYAATTETLTCVGASGGTIAAGAMHFTTALGQTYTNSEAFVLPSTGTVSVAIVADVAGSSSSAGAGAISALLTPLIGVTVTNTAAAVGADAESNANLVTRCRERLAALSVDGPHGAYDYNAKTINGDNQVSVVSGALTQPVKPCTKTRVVTDPSTGTVTTYVANDAGAYDTPPNYTEQTAKSIVSSTDASPIVVEVTGHGYVSGDTVYVADHLVNIAANGSWMITVVDADHFWLNASSGSGAGDGGATGTVYRYSDLDLIDKSIQANCVPLAVTAETLSASPVTLSVTGTITVTGPTANLADATIITAAINALALLAKLLPMGGFGTSGTLSLETIRSVLYDANPSTINVVLTFPVADVALAANEVVIFDTPTLTVARA